MKSLPAIIAAAILASSSHAHPRDSQSTFDLLKKGSNLSLQDAGKLEERVTKKPGDEEARIQLLSYYAARPTGADLSTVKAARAKHILWLIENDPQDGLGLFQVATGVYRLNCEGDELADPDAFSRTSDLWLEQVKKNPGNVEIRREAVNAIQFCSPDQAERLLIEGRNERGLGNLYAAAVLGIIGQSYLNNDPSGTSPPLRQRPFAEKARRILEEATDKDLLVGAAETLLHDGAILWADGKLDWDYTSVGNNLLVKAKAAAPDAMVLLTLPTTLPARGERPPITVRVGGNVQAVQLIWKVNPRYPQNAKELGVQGTVRMTALIGLDGKVLFLHPDSGPPELVASSMEAVRRWVYKTTTVNGKPCYVVTVIDVTYTLRR